MSHLESYYVEPGRVQGNTLTLTNEEVHHLSRVKRHKTGDRIRVVDGQGSAYEVEIISLSKTRAEGLILETRRRTAEPASELTLVPAMIKGERFDWVIEKCVEIGVHRIIPLYSENTIMKAGSGKLSRWRRVAVGAMKQCGRTLLPEITDPKSFKQVCLMGAECSLRVIAHAGSGSRDLPPSEPVPPGIRKGIALVGPEGGFTDDEIAMAVDNGYTPVSLGPRRLRAETASVVLSAILLSQWNELC